MFVRRMQGQCERRGAAREPADASVVAARRGGRVHRMGGRPRDHLHDAAAQKSVPMRVLRGGARAPYHRRLVSNRVRGGFIDEWQITRAIRGGDELRDDGYDCGRGRPGRIRWRWHAVGGRDGFEWIGYLPAFNQQSHGWAAKQAERIFDGRSRDNSVPDPGPESLSRDQADRAVHAGRVWADRRSATRAHESGRALDPDVYRWGSNEQQSAIRSRRRTRTEPLSPDSEQAARGGWEPATARPNCRCGRGEPLETDCGGWLRLRSHDTVSGARFRRRRSVTAREPRVPTAAAAVDDPLANAC